MNNLPTRYEQPQQTLVARNIQELEQLGRMASASGFFEDARQAAQAMVKIAAGQELGLAPIQSMTGIHVIKNRVTLSANLMAALLKKAGYRWKIQRFDAQECSLVMFDPTGEEVGPSSFSLQDAKTAGLSGGNWSKFPRNMLFARAISNAARWYAPEVITGCYTPEEMGDQSFVEESTVEAELKELPPHTAQVTRDNHPTTVEIDRPADGTAPKTPPPGVPVQEKKSADPRKHWFATCNEQGWLTEERQKILLGVDSRKDADPVLMDALAFWLKEVDGDDVDLVVGITDATTTTELKEAWEMLPKDYQHKLITAKNYQRSRIGSTA